MASFSQEQLRALLAAVSPDQLAAAMRDPAFAARKSPFFYFYYFLSGDHGPGHLNTTGDPTSWLSIQIGGDPLSHQFFLYLSCSCSRPYSCY